MLPGVFDVVQILGLNALLQNSAPHYLPPNNTPFFNPLQSDPHIAIRHITIFGV
jgi:hypothetical protein